MIHPDCQQNDLVILHRSGWPDVMGRLHLRTAEGKPFVSGPLVTVPAPWPRRYDVVAVGDGAVHHVYVERCVEPCNLLLDAQAVTVDQPAEAAV